MRETIGGTWIMQLVIVFMFLFAAFLALSVNYSKAFKTKNEVLSIIEKGEGISDSSLKMVSNYLITSGYRMTGKCGKNTYGVEVKGINKYSMSGYLTKKSNKKYSFCIAKYASVSPVFPDRAYYEIKLFFKFNLPVLGNISTFSVEGQTKDIAYPVDVKDKKIKVSPRR